MSNDATIKAIPTKYRGYKFRSRLEARWAVFFDTLGVQWEYEVEGYDLTYYDYDETGAQVSKHLWYLPDFWLPEWDAFVEIKPQGRPDEEAEFKASLLSVRKHKLVAIVAGNPWPGEYGVYLPSHGEEFGPAGFCMSDPCGEVWLHTINNPQSILRLTMVTRSGSDSRPWFSPTDHSLAWLERAFEAARSARFEGQRA